MARTKAKNSKISYLGLDLGKEHEEALKRILKRDGRTARWVQRKLLTKYIESDGKI